MRAPLIPVAIKDQRGDREDDRAALRCVNFSPGETPPSLLAATKLLGVKSSEIPGVVNIEAAHLRSAQSSSFTIVHKPCNIHLDVQLNFSLSLSLSLSLSIYIYIYIYIYLSTCISAYSNFRSGIVGGILKNGQERNREREARG